MPELRGSSVGAAVLLEVGEQRCGVTLLRRGLREQGVHGVVVNDPRLRLQVQPVDLVGVDDAQR
jgi:hypothetical protein